MAKDPVCNMDVDEKNARYKTFYEGRIYYFCSGSYKKEFGKNPEIYKYDEQQL